MTASRRRRVVRTVFRVAIGGATLLMVAGAGLWFLARESMGGRVEGARLERAAASPQWRDGHFDNRLRRVDGPMLRALAAFAFGGSDFRVPDAPLPVVQRSAADYRSPPASGLRVTWLGHSSMLLEIDGRRLLIDPVWGERASPFTFLGPARFFAPPLPIDELPDVDVVVISHDHYDHLDRAAIRALARRRVRFITSLGVGAHLEAWGVPEDRITELDWWDSVELDGSGVVITATPSQHFSGRTLLDRNATAWSSFHRRDRGTPCSTARTRA